MSVWDDFKKATGFDSYGPDVQKRGASSQHQANDLRGMAQASIDRDLYQALRKQQDASLANMMKGATTQVETPRKPSYPMEGRAIRALRDMGSHADQNLITSLLIDMTTSGDADERLCAAMHKLTPMSAVTMNLLDDKNAHVRYMAEKRVEAWGGVDGTD